MFTLGMKNIISIACSLLQVYSLWFSGTDVCLLSSLINVLQYLTSVQMAAQVQSTVRVEPLENRILSHVRTVLDPTLVNIYYIISHKVCRGLTKYWGSMVCLVSESPKSVDNIGPCDFAQLLFLHHLILQDDEIYSAPVLHWTTWWQVWDLKF